MNYNEIRERTQADLDARFISLDIDPRSFSYHRPVWAAHGIAADLYGDARFHWRAWYRQKRLERKGVIEPLIKGEIGRIEGFAWVTA